MISSVGVVIPVANEQATIGACLHSLEVARARLHSAVSPDLEVRIVVVLDRCIDGTAAIVRRHRRVESVACSAGRVGAARAVGTDRLLGDVRGSLRQVWLANTDADSTVPPDWLTAQVAEACRGAHLVLGTVLPEAGLAAVTESAWFDGHRLREGHPHVHGANLGIRADVYTALGGWSGLSTGEDVALAARAASAGQLQIVRTARIPVRTSSRLTGRAPRGFAGYLRELPA